MQKKNFGQQKLLSQKKSFTSIFLGRKKYFAQQKSWGKNCPKKVRPRKRLAIFLGPTTHVWPTKVCLAKKNCGEKKVCHFFKHYYKTKQKYIGATIRTSQEIQCLPYAGF